MKKQEEKEIDFNAIEEKWQDSWEEEGIFHVKEESKKEKYYVLEMFPYPSGSGLHTGHAFNFTIGDVFARYKKLKGFNVLHPMGFDALGLPAENAAIKVGQHPQDYNEKSTAYFKKQMKKLGFDYDWNRELNTINPEYYKWDQWIFLKMLEKGLAYQKTSAVNWCKKCGTVLANEQVVGGKCWRHEDTDVEVKHLKQWFLKISDYADELLESHKKIDWPNKTLAMQKNWIGKSHGVEINFEIENSDNDSLKKWPIFTTRPDTIYGVTFMVISAQHSRLDEFVTKEQKKEVDKFLKKLKGVSEKQLEGMEKEGVFTGSYAVNPLAKEKIPIYAGNFVVADYGSGMVMAVPAHDQRDFEFAKKYGIDTKVVIQPETYELNGKKMSRAYTGEGKLVNSGEFDGWNNREAIDEITKYLTKKKIGKKVTQYKLRDWLISRQRYWGTPIPVVYCDKCGVVPVPEKNLPVELPYDVKFGKGNPLLTNEEWIKTKCPKCKGDARRETDTMDTFVNSSWYFFRYCDPKNDKKIFDKKKVDYWMPIDFYVGGKEHACMHLIYSRFYTKFLRDIGLIDFDEPAKKLFHQGMVHAEDGKKMSKSLGNVVDPLDTIEKYSADSLRMFLVSVASPDSDWNWNEKGLQSIHKFLIKVWNYFENVKIGKTDKKIESKINSSIIEIEKDIEDLKYNLVIIKLREFFGKLNEEDETSKDVLEKFLIMLNPFCPHVTEELWEKIGNNKTGKKFIFLAKWPEADESKIDKKLEEQEKNVEKLIEDINNIVNLVKEKSGEEKSKAFVYIIPNEKDVYESEKEIISNKTNLEVKIYAVNDKDKIDPENKSKKSKPGKPAIYLE